MRDYPIILYRHDYPNGKRFDSYETEFQNGEGWVTNPSLINYPEVSPEQNSGRSKKGK